MRQNLRLSIIAFTALAAPVVAAGWVMRSDDSEAEPIRYSASTPTDPIARLQKLVDSRQVVLTYEPGKGYLVSLLQALKIPISSQMLVFSKTSFQRELISPETPRALYYREGTYVGFVQNAPVLEIATQDPQLGATFYLLEQKPQSKPRFVRQVHECLQCHESGLTKGIPGHLMRSVFPDANGQPIFTAGTYITTDQSPMRERWGGWYVTGKH
jgi:hypothetical protein